MKHNNVYSNTYDLANGVPQGSVLSGTLFIIGINDIVKQLPAKVKNNLYVDDFAIFYSSRSMRHLQRILSKAVAKVYIWSKTVGLRLALDKTQGIVCNTCIQYANIMS